MENVKRAQEHLSKAHELRQGSVGWYREVVLGVRSVLNKIRLDANLTEKGKMEKMDKARKAHGESLLKALQDRNAEYVAELEKAKKYAEKAINTKPNKPSEAAQERFQASYNRLKTRLLLETRPESAADRLVEFISDIADPYFAGIVHDDYSNLVMPILESASGREGVELRKRLANVYDSIEQDFMSDEERAARAVLNMSNAMLERPSVLANEIGNELSAVMASARDTYGAGIAKWIREPEKYFEQKQENE